MHLDSESTTQWKSSKAPRKHSSKHSSRDKVPREFSFTIRLLTRLLSLVKSSTLEATRSSRSPTVRKSSSRAKVFTSSETPLMTDPSTSREPTTMISCSVRSLNIPSLLSTPLSTRSTNHSLIDMMSGVSVTTSTRRSSRPSLTSSPTNLERP